MVIPGLTGYLLFNPKADYFVHYVFQFASMNASHFHFLIT